MPRRQPGSIAERYRAQERIHVITMLDNTLRAIRTERITTIDGFSRHASYFHSLVLLFTNEPGYELHLERARGAHNANDKAWREHIEHEAAQRRARTD